MKESQGARQTIFQPAEDVRVVMSWSEREDQIKFVIKNDNSESESQYASLSLIFPHDKKELLISASGYEKPHDDEAFSVPGFDDEHYCAERVVMTKTLPQHRGRVYAEKIPQEFEGAVRDLALGEKASKAFETAFGIVQDGMESKNLIFADDKELESRFNDAPGQNFSSRSI